MNSYIREWGQDRPRFLKLLALPEITKRIQSGLSTYRCDTEKISADRSLGRVCAEVVKTEQDIPPSAISAMDGYALRSSELRSASLSKPVGFLVKGSIYPGDSSNLSRIKVSGREAYHVATGARIPEGSDVVVRVEETRREDGLVLVRRRIPKLKDVVLRGEDVRSGEILLRKGHILNSADVALLIALGRKTVRVFRSPRVGLLSIGDELGILGDQSTGKTVNNYSNLLCGYLEEMGAQARSIGVCKDHPAEIRSLIEKGIEDFDMLLTIGGSSVGARDFTPDAVGSMEDSVLLFHGVRLAPIRPVGMALVRGKPVAILPGHAVSAALSFFLIALPTLNLLSGLPFNSRRSFVKALAPKRISNDRAMDALFLVEMRSSGGRHYATPLEWGSNSMRNLSKANGFIYLKKRQVIQRSEEVEVELMGSSEFSRIPQR